MSPISSNLLKEDTEVLLPHEYDLSRLIGGEVNLSRAAYNEIYRFTLMYSLAEAKIPGMNEGMGNTRNVVMWLDSVVALDHDFVEKVFTHFRNRYVTDDGRINYRFSRYLLPQNSPVGAQARSTFEALLVNSGPDFIQRASCVFKVMFRLRNNLFHGAKWAYNLSDQEVNFSLSSQLLLACLERTKGITWQPNS
ncbi:TPA: hypothetical protein ACKQDY_000975 [Serratia marcescens]|nr:hypothetical protein [Serratia marcescens]